MSVLVAGRGQIKKLRKRAEMGHSLTGGTINTSPLIDRILEIDSSVFPTSTTQGSGSDIRARGQVC